MKFTFLIIFLLALFSGCHKESFDIKIYYPGSMTYGKASAAKEDKDWVASGIALRHDDKPNEFIGITLGTVSEEGFRRESIVFYKIPIARGEYMIKGNSPIYDGFVSAHYAILADDGDLLEDSYVPSENLNNHLIITEIDTISNFLRGTFNVTFELVNPDERTNPQNPERITFSNGIFEVQIKE